MKIADIRTPDLLLVRQQHVIVDFGKIVWLYLAAAVVVPFFITEPGPMTFILAIVAFMVVFFVFLGRAKQARTVAAIRTANGNLEVFRSQKVDPSKIGDALDLVQVASVPLADVRPEVRNTPDVPNPAGNDPDGTPMRDVFTLHAGRPVVLVSSRMTSDAAVDHQQTIREMVARALGSAAPEPAAAPAAAPSPASPEKGFSL